MIFLLSFIDLANSEDCRFRDLTVSKYNRLSKLFITKLSKLFFLKSFFQ